MGLSETNMDLSQEINHDTKKSDLDMANFTEFFLHGLIKGN